MKKQPGFWTYFAISISIVVGALSANFSAKAQDSFTVEVIGNATFEFNPQARHFMMLDQPDWLTSRIERALKD